MSKILVVEDTPTQAAMVKIGLQRHGHEVVLARDGIEAIEKVYQERPDLIVSDVVMPRLNGYQVCRLLKDDRQTMEIPVILLTSLDQKQDMFWGLKSGADKYITKGGDIPLLVEEIQGFFTEWSSRPENVRAGGGGSEIAADLDFDVIERVIKLLDRNLFESTVISETQNLVNILDDYGKTIASVLEILSTVVDFHVGCIYLHDDEVLDYHFFVNKGVEQSFIDRMREAVTSGLDSKQSGSVQGQVREQIHDPGELLTERRGEPAEIASFCSSIFTTRGEPTGIIALASGEENNFTERSAHTFEIIARQANIVIDYARLYEKTKQLSITDGLTKVFNHRYFQDQLRREWSRSQRQETPLSLIMMDIDHFKSFNDTYGHQQGDIVLMELAKLLQSQIRSCDILARYGGEEFAIIMPDTDNNVAAKVAERLRRNVAEHPIPGQGEDLRISISMGVASVPHPEISSAPELIGTADQALYRAKEKGRNRVEC